jgi:hypothetical protein
MQQNWTAILNQPEAHPRPVTVPARARPGPRPRCQARPRRPKPPPPAPGAAPTCAALPTYPLQELIKKTNPTSFPRHRHLATPLCYAPRPTDAAAIEGRHLKPPRPPLLELLVAKPIRDRPQVVILEEIVKARSPPPSSSPPSASPTLAVSGRPPVRAPPRRPCLTLEHLGDPASPSLHLSSDRPPASNSNRPSSPVQAPPR